MLEFVCWMNFIMSRLIYCDQQMKADLKRVEYDHFKVIEFVASSSEWIQIEMVFLIPAPKLLNYSERALRHIGFNSMQL